MLAVLPACGGSDPPTRLEISPSNLRLATGSTVTFAAHAVAGDGQALPDAPVTWSSSAPAVATVSDDGRVQGLAPGTATLRATSQGATAETTVTVATPAVVNVYGAQHVLAPGTATQLRAEVLDADNLPLVATVAWSSADPALASVDANGRVAAIANGVTSVSVAAGGAAAGVGIAVQDPVGAQIAFVSQREASYGTPVPQPNGGVYLMNADGSGVHLQVPDSRLACNADTPGSPDQCPFPVTSPAMAPDGLRVAVVALVHWDIEFTGTVIEICATAQPLCERVDFPRQTRPPGPVVTLHDVQAPAWSPDGSRLAFVSAAGTLWVWTLDTASWVELAGTQGASNPAWSPDGARIAYAAPDAGVPAIWLVGADGSGRVRLSGANADDSHPSWSPDGRRMAFARTLAGNSDIFVMNADGSGVANLTQHPAQDRNPSWSPDGRRIAFETDRDGNVEIYLMNPDGSGLVDLTNHPATDGQPDWSR